MTGREQLYTGLALRLAARAFPADPGRGRG
jgi:hypothetical protein